MPGPGQESVWDYPRPPSLEQTGRHIVVELGGEVIADTRRAWRVCETSHPPVYYVPLEDIAAGVLRPSAGGSFCEWKGQATYWNVEAGGVSEPDAGWSYESPTTPFAAMAGAGGVLPGPDGPLPRRRRGGPPAGRAASTAAG